MTEVTSAEFQKNFGTYKKEALKKPVEISIHGKPTLVMLSKQEFDRLNARQDGQENSVSVKAHEPSAATSSTLLPMEQPTISKDQFRALEAMLNTKAGVRFAEKPR